VGGVWGGGWGGVGGGGGGGEVVLCSVGGFGCFWGGGLGCGGGRKVWFVGCGFVWGGVARISLRGSQQLSLSDLGKGSRGWDAKGTRVPLGTSVNYFSARRKRTIRDELNKRGVGKGAISLLLGRSEKKKGETGERPSHSRSTERGGSMLGKVLSTKRGNLGEKKRFTRRSSINARGG